MITTIFIVMFVGLFNFLIGLLPTGSLNVGFANSLTTLLSDVQSYNSVFPIDTTLLIIQLIALFEVARFLFKLINWTLGFIRGARL